MIYDHMKNRADGVRIAYIGGGSRAWANVLMTDLALEGRLSGTVSLYDLNIEAAEENATVGNRTTARAEVAGKWKYETAKTLRQALTGADFVFISILPGTFEEMRSDIHAPEKYGIYQSVGDTTGPGGIIRALRAIPMFLEFADSIKAHCPDAWVVNFTNPMALSVRALYEAFPKIKAFGCCHEVFDTQLDVADMLDVCMGIKGVKTHDIKINVMGVNHFTWIDKMSYMGLDLMPMYAKIAREHAGDGYEREENKHWRNSVFRCQNMVKFDLFNRYGVAAAAGDRHLAEFMPPWYLKDPETVDKWGFALTSADWRLEDRREADERRKRLIAGEAEIELAPTGEESVLQMMAILGLGDYVTNVNMPNAGQMDGVEPGAVVETNAHFTRGGVMPIYAGRLPGDVLNLVLRHTGNSETILQAALTGDKRLAFNAFINDPLVAGLDVYDAKRLFDEMIDNTKAYLPEKWGW